MTPIITNPHDYQDEAINTAFRNWNNGIQNQCLVAPTGAGKTVIKAFAAKRFIKQYPNKFALTFAHRDVLLNQISMTAAKVGIPHKMICSKATEREIADAHMEELGESFLTDRSRLIIASVPTWIRRDTAAISSMTGFWQMDEAHHLLEENQWGEAVSNLKHAWGLGVTATPLRADGKGLGRHADGVFDNIIETPDMGELIRRNRLSPYKVYTIPSRVDTSSINITSSGDYNQKKLAKETDRADITGDAVDHYLRLANGKQGIVFAASVLHADHVAAQFRAAGINAVSLSSKTNPTERRNKVAEFRRGRIQLLVNYDLFGEGFDVPAVEVVIMLRKTLSYGLFMQMFGRALRVLAGKQYGILIDHVGNVQEHCSHKQHIHESPIWTLDRTSKKRIDDGDDPSLRICPKCRFSYFPLSKHIRAYNCPDCGHAESSVEVIQAQRELIHAQGTLVEYDTGYLENILKERAKVDKPGSQIAYGMSKGNISKRLIPTIVDKHNTRRTNQEKLRKSIMHWCEEIAKIKQLDVKTTQAEFERTFGINIFKAQVIGSTEALELLLKIKDDLIEKTFTFVMS